MSRREMLISSHRRLAALHNTESRRDAPAPSLVRGNCRRSLAKPENRKTLRFLGFVPAIFLTVSTA
jgi:hypothetical protein